MHRPLFTLQIIDQQGRLVQGFAGASPLERDLIQACTTAIVQALSVGKPEVRDLIDSATHAIVARGVGLFRTEKHVAQDIRDGLRETLRDPREAIEPAVRDALISVLRELKRETRLLVGP